MIKFHFNQRGFSLAEVVIAATILTAVGVTVLRVGISARASSPLQMNRSGAQNVARIQMENLYESVRQDQWGAGGQPLTVGERVIPDAIVNGTTYIYRGISAAATAGVYTVANVALDNGNVPDYRRVDVRVNCANCG